MNRLGSHLVKLIAGALLLPALLVVAPGGAARASLTYTFEHQFQFDVPTGWAIQLSLDEYDEPDLVMVALSDDEDQEINVYKEALLSRQQNALDYLQDSFSSAASNPTKANVQVLTQPRRATIASADSGAYGVYAFTDPAGVRQVVMRLVGVRGSTVYELNALPTQAYARDHPNELQGVPDSFRLLP